MNNMALAIHGGAGTISRSSMTADLEREYRNGLEAALRAGWSILEDRGSAIEAVEAAVVSLEDFPLFNAGRGSVFTHEGTNEMDAAIMDGSALKAGAVAFVRNVKNPIKLARLVMQRTEHVLLAADGANKFATEMNVEHAPDEYFFTEHRWQQLQDAIAAGRVQLDHTPAETRPVGSVSRGQETSLGTVGAVACDSEGRLAAATSTGGMTNKKFGRVGDTPIIGAGNYADGTCAVSCTGHGEYFMLGVTAYDVAARMKYKGLSLDDAASETIEHLTSIGGEGGLIAVDSLGNIVLPFNSDGMYRGYVTADVRPSTEIYGD
ncbi:MAG TPA: isoaspartyl peptidase/L-asparaginase [Pyrinomonadaceae bacterium]|nr:isoaspartyl peptidase/L-asparaginase [Chloracidobacterium sp.]HBE81147.1 beta-aspartyl-peptidase [Blastocatellia bacterium]HRJ87064.1 isoaspartyl peptidase/L-asparaginase [Pyrinomonadaceae bacterium]HRK51531.1 isoaspartyl peptidase/L-asparaginase [Pyrinomonadaceae bacterium]